MALLTILIMALVTGVFMGFIFQRSQFCTALASNEAFTFHNYGRFQGILVLLIVSTIVFNILIWLGVVSKFNLLPAIGIDAPTLCRTLPFTLPGPLGAVMPVINLIGGVVFGFGMMLAGGCVAGTLFRIGEGYIASIIALIGISAGGLGIAMAIILGLAGIDIPVMGEMLTRLPSGQTLPELLGTDIMPVALLFSALYLGLYFLLRGLGRVK